MVAKVTVSLPDELLARLDAEADALGVSRSLLVQEATASYLGESAQTREAARRGTAVRRSIEGMREMAARNPRLDGRGSAEMLRDVRSLEGSE
jgi:metal-responsive CopG/Arc/MetJ family transcriptional regulator